MKKTLLLLAISLSLFFSCGKPKLNPEKMAIDFLFANAPELVNVKDIDTIITYEADSFYLPLTQTEQYKEFRKEVNERYFRLSKEIEDYERWERRFGDTPINGGLVNLYQNFVREDIIRLKELKSVYKSIYKGIRVPVYVEYKTSFKDSIYLADVIMNNELDSLIEIQDYINCSKDDLVYYIFKSTDDFILGGIDEIKEFRHDSIFEPDTTIFINPKIRK